MTAPVLSILVAAVDRRAPSPLMALLGGLWRQAEGRPVEVLCLLDNRRRSIGAKRQSLLDIARGDYVAFVDDDDRVSDAYTETLLALAAKDPDVICFKQLSYLNGRGPYGVEFTADVAVDEEVRIGEFVRRPPWHVCAWRRSLAVQSRFPDSNYGEDFDWVSRLRPLIRRGEYADVVLHEYHHDANASEASL